MPPYSVMPSAVPLSQDSSRPRTPTLGQTLRQARTAQRRSLLDVAARVAKTDGTQLSPQYLSDIEYDRRRPSPQVLAELARTLGLDETYLLGKAQRAESVVRAYLRAHQEQEQAVIAFFRLAHVLRFEAWERFRQMVLRGEIYAVSAAERSNFCAPCPEIGQCQGCVRLGTEDRAHEWS